MLALESALPPEVQHEIMHRLVETHPGAAWALMQASAHQARIPSRSVDASAMASTGLAPARRFATAGQGRIPPAGAALEASDRLTRALGGGQSSRDARLAVAVCLMQAFFRAIADGLVWAMPIERFGPAAAREGDLAGRVDPLLDALPLAARARTLYSWIAGGAVNTTGLPHDRPTDPANPLVALLRDVGAGAGYMLRPDDPLVVRELENRGIVPGDGSGSDPRRSFIVPVGMIPAGEFASEFGGTLGAVYDVGLSERDLLDAVFGPHREDSAWVMRALGSGYMLDLLRDRIDEAVASRLGGACVLGPRSPVALPRFSDLFPGSLYIIPFVRGWRVILILMDLRSPWIEALLSPPFSS
jgi:hypothetical protein